MQPIEEGQLEYLEYPEYADIMELFVETLTGTVFELRVSPFETVISVKAKIQRLEGIPISQQHLIWRAVELEDDYCLHDYGIPPSSSLKLVLAMRGGPINTRRVPVEDPAIREMTEYMEANRDEIWEKLPGNRQVTLLVFREGDQLNFFRVVDRGDGTLTPLSESLSGASMYNMADEEEEEQAPSNEQNQENEATMNKMKLLREKMESLSITKKKQKVPKPPSSGKPKTTTRRRLLSAKKTTAAPSLNKNNPLPPLGDFKHSSSSRAEIRDLSSSMPQLPQKVSDDENSRLSHKDLYDGASASTKQQHRKRTSEKSRKSPVEIPARRTPLESLSSARLHRSYTNISTGIPMVHTPGPPSVREDIGRSTSSASGLVSSGSADVRIARERSSLKTADQRVAAREKSSHKTHEARIVTELVNQASREGKISDLMYSPPRDTHTGKGSGRSRVTPGAGTLSFGQTLHTSSSSAFISASTSGERIKTPDGRKTLISAHSIRGRLPRSSSREGRLVSSPSHRLPPVLKSSNLTGNGSSGKKKSSSKRCFLCNKKTGLATSYMCRCSRNYCATHRYAETHNCGYDYKTEGRKLLEQSNPIVNAPKLPKI